MQNRYKKLVSNSLLFMLTQFGSKVLMIAVVPLYTYLLTTSEYGAIELATTTLTVAAPCCMLLIYDAVLRFCMSKDLAKDLVLTSAIKVFFVGCLLTLVVIPFTSIISSLRAYSLLIYLLVISYCLFYVFSQFAKGINVKVFVLSGIIYTAAFLACNVLFIVLLRKGVSGYIMSQLIGYVVASLYCFLRLKIWKYIKFNLNTKPVTRQMLGYSVLLIPNALVWWVIASANRYFIEGYLGSDANGIYGIAAKIPTIITIVGTIFIQAWQLSAIDEKEQNTDLDSRRTFFTNVFNSYSCALVICTSLILVVCKPLLTLILSSDFHDAWRYVPLLLLSSIYMMYAQFWSSLFVAEKSSKELSYSSIISGLLSLVLNWLFIPRGGLFGAAAVGFVSCFIMWILRIISARKYNMIQVNFPREIYALIALLAQCGVLLLMFDEKISYIINVLLFVFIVVLYKKEFGRIVQMGKGIYYRH